MATKNPKTLKKVETLEHEEASRRNIPTAAYPSLMEKESQSPIQVAYEPRNRDLDPQLVWRGKDEQDWSDLVVPAPALYIQEKLHPKVLIDDLLRRSKEGESQRSGANLDLFADFNGLPNDQNWSNRMILGDSLQAIARRAERRSPEAVVRVTCPGGRRQAEACERTHEGSGR